MESLLDTILESISIDSLSEGLFSRKKKPAKEPVDNDAELKKLFDEAKAWWNNPYTLGDGYDDEVLVWCRLIGMSERDVCTNILKHKKVESLPNYVKSIDGANKIFKTGKFCVVQTNDDYALVIEPSSKMMYEIFFSSKDEISRFNYSAIEADRFYNSEISEWLKKHNITSFK